MFVIIDLPDITCIYMKISFMDFSLIISYNSVYKYKLFIFQLLVGSSGAGNGGAATSPDGGSSSAPPLSPGGSGVVGGALSPGAGSHASTPAASCCDTPRPIITDPVSGQTVCSCQYDGARLALTSYPRLSSAAVGVYGAPYPSTDQNPYPSIGVDSSAFYSPLVSRPNFYLSFSYTQVLNLVHFLCIYPAV